MSELIHAILVDMPIDGWLAIYLLARNTKITITYTNN